MARVQKDVRYLNKDFGAFREGLIEFTKTYYPNTYNDFNEASPGMMFIEMASYVGDVLSYYVDTQFKEMLLAYAEETKTIYEMAQVYGYKPKITRPSFTDVDVFQTVPATGTGTSVKPDMNYTLTLNEGSQLTSNNGTVFRTLEDCNFKFSSSFDPLTIDVYEINQTTKVPSFYLLKKSVRISSGTIKSETFPFGAAESYPRIKLAEPDVIEIISVTDSDSNTWNEVPYLAQDTTFIEMENTSANDPSLVQYNDTVPYLLKLKKTPRRFVTYIIQDGSTELRFGAGISDSPDEEIIPNPNSVGSSLPGSPTFLDTYFDPANFLKTEAYGQAPSNTTLTVKFSYGGGIGDNVAADSLINITDVGFTQVTTGLNTSLVSSTQNSLAVNNPYPATGGKSAESTIEIKNNALAYFQAQQRNVTKEDYIVRAYSLPAKFGNIAKVHLVQDDQLNKSAQTDDLERTVTQADVDKKINGISAADTVGGKVWWQNSITGTRIRQMSNHTGEDVIQTQISRVRGMHLINSDLSYCTLCTVTIVRLLIDIVHVFCVGLYICEWELCSCSKHFMR